MKLLALVFLAVQQTLSFAQTDFGAEVMVINGQSVKASEYYRRMEFLSGVGRMTPAGFATASPGFLTLQRILDEKLMLQLAEELKCAPTDAEVDLELADRIAESPDLLTNWQKSGGSEAELKYSIRLELVELKIVSQGINVTDQELETFYKANPTMFTFPKRFKLRVLAVPDEGKRDAADQELKAGISFTEVVKKHSEHPSKFNDGQLGELPVDVMSASFKAAVEGVKIGNTSDWVKTDNAFLKFLVEGISPERIQPLDDRTRRQLRRKLAVDRGRVKVDIAKMMAAARAKAKVTVNLPAFKPAIDRYLKDSGLIGG